MSHQGKPSELYALLVEFRTATTQAAINRAYDKIKAFKIQEDGWERHETSVNEKTGEPGDTYFTVEFQVREANFDRNQQVEVLLRPLQEESCKQS